jgi:hypothetical protein
MANEEVVSIRAILRDELSAQMDKVRASIKGTTTVTKEQARESTLLSRSLEGLRRQLFAGLGLVGIIRFARQSLQLAKEQAEAESRLLFALKGRTQEFERLKNLTADLQKETVFDDDDLKKQTALLLNMGIGVGSIDKALQATIDTATALDLSFDEVGKSIAQFEQGQAGRLAARVPELKELERNGQLAARGLDVLAEKFKGAAKAAADTSFGRFTQQIKALHDVQEEIGNQIIDLLIPNVEKFKEVVGGVLAVLREYKVALDDIGLAIGAIIGGIPLSKVGEFIRDTKKREQQLLNAKSLNKELATRRRLEAEIAALRRSSENATRLIADFSINSVVNITIAKALDTLRSASPEVAEQLTEIFTIEFERQLERQKISLEDFFLFRRSLETQATRDAIALQQRIIDKERERLENAKAGVEGSKNAAESLESRLSRDGSTLIARTEKEKELLDGAVRSRQEMNKFLGEQLDAEQKINAALERQAALTAQLTEKDQKILEDRRKRIQEEKERTDLPTGFFAGLSEQVLELGQIGRVVAHDLVDGFGEWIDGLIQGRKSFRELVADFLRGIAVMIAKTLLLRAIGSTGLFGPGVGDNAGGPVLQRARGGAIPGPNVNRDVVPIMATPGEFVISREAVRLYGMRAMQALNEGLLPRELLDNPRVPADAVQVGRRRLATGGAVTGGSGSGQGGGSTLVADERTMARLIAGGEEALFRHYSQRRSTILAALGIKGSSR